MIEEPESRSDVEVEVDEESTAPATTAPPEYEPPAGLTARVSSFFVVLDKLLRATRLYEGRGALVDRLLGETATRAAPALEGGEFTVRVTPFGLLLEDEEVAPPKSRLTEALFNLFCDGIRELTFSRGLGSDDLRALVDVLVSDPRQGEDDYSTLLWKRELKHIHFYATDTLQSGADLAGEGGQQLLGAAERSRVQNAAAESAQEFVLSPDDLRMLKTDDHLSWVRECAAPMAVGKVNEATVQNVRDAFATPFDHARFLQMAVRAAEESPKEASPLVLDMFDSMVLNRDAQSVANLLTAALNAARMGGFAAKSLRAGLLEPARVTALAPLYERTPELLAGPLEDAASEFPDALVGLLNELPPGPPRDGLLALLSEAGVDLTAYYRRCLNDENEDLVIGAIDALSGFDTDAATSAITEALGYTSTRVRRKALQCLVGHYPAEARVAVARALGDPDRDNRLLALKVLTDSGDKRAAGNILGRIEDSAFAHRDDEEQMALLGALARFKDPRTVPYFSGVLAGIKLARGSRRVARQLLAVDALASIPGDQAREALVKSSKKWGLPREVKVAAKRAADRSKASS